MNIQRKDVNGEDPGRAVWRQRLAIVPIVAGNAVPVVGVWFLGWEPLRPIFFYWLDGLLAVWGLGVVAVVVTSRGKPKNFGTSGVKLWLTWIAVILVVESILAIPSVVAAMVALASMQQAIGGVMREMFARPGTWISLAIVVWSYAGQTMAELRWKPDLTLRETGEARANLFIHRTIVMALLVFWGATGQPPRWALAIYVLVVAVLFTFIQLNPERYLSMIGFKTRGPSRFTQPNRS